jgi:four helix bundle protein
VRDERPHRNLDVWKRSIDLAKYIYRISSQFPSTEQYGLASQMRRAVVSIASNISEGAARSSNKEFLQFINIAQGSASELDTQLELAKELGYVDQITYEEVINDIIVVTKQLYGLARTVRDKM